jgi:hypothetical protein
MAAPLAWLREAIDRRSAVHVNGGPRVSVSIGVNGVTIFSEAQAVFRSWEDLDRFTSNPLSIAVDLCAQAAKIHIDGRNKAAHTEEATARRAT